MSDEPPELTTERLRLEPLLPAHAEPLFAGLCHPDLYPFLDDAAPTDVAALRARYTRLAVRRSPDGTEIWLNWALRARDDERYLGYVQATVGADCGAAEVAYVVFVDAWHQGYAREATAAMIAYLTSTGVARFTARVDPRNVRSAALLRALGFERTSSGTVASTDHVYGFSTRLPA